MKNSLIIFFVMIARTVFAQTDSCYSSLHQFDTTNYKFNGKYLLSYWSDTKTVFTSPFHWKGTDFAWAGAFVAADVLLYWQDKNINNFFQRNRTPFTNSVANVIEPFGNDVYVFGADALLWGGALIAKDKKLQHETLEAAKTLVFTGITVQVVKWIARRQRPYVADEPYNWFGPFNNDNYESFYSGDATMAFTWATNISLDSKKKLLPAIAYTVAGLVALERMNNNEHWASDVFTGAVVSTYITNKIFKGKNW